MSSRMLATAATTVLLVAACSSNADDGGGDDAFGIGQPTTATTQDDAATVDDPSSTTRPDDDQTPTSTPTSPTTSTATPTPDAAGPLTEPVVELFDVGTFEQPVGVAEWPGHGEAYVIEQAGRVVAVSDLSTEVVLDITDLTSANGEQGLLGLAFHPTDALAYVNFTDADGDTVVAEFAVDAATSRFDRGTLREVLTIDQPYGNHNGGQLTFGPDQLLYIGVGDGGSADDPERHALDLTGRLGKILRIDPVASGSGPFSVPADNPFVDTDGADPTIWSYGLRNPWKFSFDPVTGDLWIADVGQSAFEEINHSVATDRRDAGRGANYGWSAFEGFDAFNSDQSAPDAVMPRFVYEHTDGRCSVTGGALVRGDAVADLQGWYVFGDYCSGQIWALDPTTDPSEPRVIEIARLDTLVALAAGPGGEFYAVSGDGTVARFITA